MDIALLWIPATIAAATAQTARNALQRSLTQSLGTIGATQVRFLFGLPFGILFLAAVVIFTGEPIPFPTESFAGFIVLGATTQIGATALMLAAMRTRSFSVVTAYVKTEPVQVAVFGFIVLGDAVSVPVMLAIVVATSGVVLMSHRPRQISEGGLSPAILGLAAGALFGLAAVGFRGAVLSLDSGSFLIRATTVLVWGLAIQTAILLAYMAIRDRSALRKSLMVWRESLFAGFLGALASQFWFIGFALTSAANVRTLALVEVIMAQIISRRLFSQEVSPRATWGMALIVFGVLALLYATAAR